MRILFSNLKFREMNFVAIKLNASRVSRIYFPEENVIYKSDIWNSKTGYFHCVHGGCKSRGKIESNVFYRTNNAQHENHIYTVEAEYEIALNKFKLLAGKSTRPLRDIYDEISSSLSLEAAGLFEWNNTRHAVQKIRRSFMPPCKSLIQLSDLLESNAFIKQKFGVFRSSQFYYGTVDLKFIFFVNEIMVKHITPDFELYMDSTFSIVPFHAKQLTVLMANIKGKPRVFAFIIMPRRKSNDYVKVLPYP